MRNTGKHSADVQITCVSVFMKPQTLYNEPEHPKSQPVSSSKSKALLLSPGFDAMNTMARSGRSENITGGSTPVKFAPARAQDTVSWHLFHMVIH